MFRFIQEIEVGGDCTCGYDIELDKEHTVKSFIQTVLIEKSKEWGYIGIYKKGTWFGDPHLEYRYGNIITKQLPEEYLNMQIAEVKASGGWTRMDYIITCS